MAPKVQPKIVRRRFARACRDRLFKLFMEYGRIGVDCVELCHEVCDWDTYRAKYASRGEAPPLSEEDLQELRVKLITEVEASVAGEYHAWRDAYRLDCVRVQKWLSEANYIAHQTDLSHEH